MRTVQSTMVMCFAAVLASTSASSSLTLFSTDISRGLFSGGRSGDSNLHQKPSQPSKPVHQSTSALSAYVYASQAPSASTFSLSFL